MWHRRICVNDAATHRGLYKKEPKGEYSMYEMKKEYSVVLCDGLVGRAYFECGHADWEIRRTERGKCV